MLPSSAIGWRRHRDRQRGIRRCTHCFQGASRLETSSILVRTFCPATSSNTPPDRSDSAKRLCTPHGQPPHDRDVNKRNCAESQHHCGDPQGCAFQDAFELLRCRKHTGPSMRYTRAFAGIVTADSGGALPLSPLNDFSCEPTALLHQFENFIPGSNPACSVPTIGQLITMEVRVMVTLPPSSAAKMASSDVRGSLSFPATVFTA